MKIREYKIIHNQLKHPKLWEAHVYEWNGGKFTSYEKMVNMLINCFNMNKLNEEYAYVLAFNWAMELLGVYECSHGSTKSTPVTKEIFTFLLLCGADQFVVAHNHPNGSLKMSQEDDSFTTMINGQLWFDDLKFLESIIVSKKGFSLIMEQQMKKLKKSLPKLANT